MGLQLVLAILVSLAGPLAAQERDAACALGFDTPSDTDADYRVREGDRCEGIYIRPAAASTRLILRGFHLGSPRYELAEGGRLTVEVLGSPSSPEAEGRLIAKSMRPRHFYQMDTRALDARGRYLWSTEILRHPEVELQPHELAVLYSEGDLEERPTVWPVRVTDADTASASAGGDSTKRLLLIFETEARLDRILLRVANHATGEVVDERPLVKRFASDAPIEVRLRVDAPGTYDVSATAIDPSGQDAKTTLRAVVSAEALFGAP